MNDDESIDLETELRRLRPRPVSRQLQRAISAQLSSPLPRARPRSAVAWSSEKWINWGVAAALVALMTFARSRPVSPRAVPTDGFVPVAAVRTIYDAQDEGVITLADGTPGRRVRSRYVDTITWSDPASQASLQWSVPREEVSFVPLRLN